MTQPQWSTDSLKAATDNLRKSREAAAKVSQDIADERDQEAAKRDERDQGVGQ